LIERLIVVAAHAADRAGFEQVEHQSREVSISFHSSAAYAAPASVLPDASVEKGVARGVERDLLDSVARPRE